MSDKKTFNIVLGFLFFGSLWGLFEASFGDWLYSRGIPNASIYLTVIALFILASSKVFLQYKWSGTLIGFIAMLFKMINVPFFACHLLAILLLGSGLDISCQLVSKYYKGKFRLPVIGLFGAYIGYALFALTITYVVRYQYWTEVGLPKVIDYIFISGSISAFISMIAVPAGDYIGRSVREFSWTKLYPRFSTGVVLVAILSIWVIQQVI